MLVFGEFGRAVAAQFQKMVPTGLYRVEIDKDSLWKTYLESFPAGSNPMLNKATEHDCHACHSFIKVMGSVVTIVGNKAITVWDCQIDGPYGVVAKAMSDLVQLGVSVSGISNVFRYPYKTVGTAKDHQLLPDQSVRTWEHFFVNLPKEVVLSGDLIGPALSSTRADYDVLLRGLRELTTDSVDTVLELVAQNSLYRGQESKFALEGFRRIQTEFAKLTALEEPFYPWTQLAQNFSIIRIRNTAIGTLLIDLSAGLDLEDAVRKFETSVMAPSNYKRPTALVSKAMIAKAQDKIVELGLLSALERRYATIDDIAINDIKWANREAKKSMNVFDELSAKVPDAVPKDLSKVEEVPIADFMAKVLPKAESVEILVENRHAGNFVSLIAPADPTAARLFKWPNQFSWSYAGDVTDSIKAKVKAAGGKVDGDFRASLSWWNTDDLDLHLVQPTGVEVFYGQKKDQTTGGNLDVDMNIGGDRRDAVENITYPDRAKMPNGTYLLRVHNYTRRESIDVGFDVEIEVDGVLYSFAYKQSVPNKQFVDVCSFSFDQKAGFKVIQSLPAQQASRTIWSIPTQTFRKASVIMLSPNHWDNSSIGNLHYFFMLDGCNREDKARGLYNEFLSAELEPHRKVLEVVGSKMKTEESDQQLSGLGFSSTQHNSVLCRVKGHVSRIVKVTF